MVLQTGKQVKFTRDSTIGKGALMTKVTYVVVEHDGGWTYKVGEVFSETFRHMTRPSPLLVLLQMSSGSPARRLAFLGKTSRESGTRKFQRAMTVP
jgi:hypothetical protein